MYFGWTLEPRARQRRVEPWSGR